MSSEARGLVRAVRGRADLNTDEQAARAVAATLTTLAERVAGGLPAEVLAKVPDDLRSKLRREPEGGLEDRDVFDIEEFFRRVGEREAIDLQAAVDHALAVTEALCEEVSASTLAGLRVRLPDEFQRLFVGATGGRGAPRP
jgi:uncharacterized protein (DUF2267 family)